MHSTTASDLSLPEQVLLLALRDREGTIAFGANYLYALGGAIIAELLLDGRLETVRKGKQVLAACPPGGGRALADADAVDGVLQECVAMVADSKPHKLGDWVTRFGSMRDLKHRVARGLCARGILRADADTVLLVFTRKVYPEIDPGPEQALLERMRAAVHGDGPVETRLAILISIARAAGLLSFTFDRKELKARRERLDAIAAGDVCAEATKEAIEAMQAAILVAVIIPTVVT